MGDTLINDRRAQLGQAVNVAFAGAEVATLLRVGEQPPRGIAIVAIIFGSIDSTLSRNAVGATGRILETETLHLVAHRSHRSRRRRTGQTRANDKDLVFGAVVGADQTKVILMIGPSVLNRTFR